MLIPMHSTATKDRLSQDELGNLLKALAFPRDLFNRNVPKDFFKEDSISVARLLECCDSRYFYHDLNFTINLKSGAYNNQILKKSIVLLSSGMISFTDLQNVRLAFEAYEEYDQRGMCLKERTLLRTIKLCNRMISPQKLMKKLRYVQSSFKENGRIQLYEFLDLLAICEPIASSGLGNASSDVLDKTWRNLYCVDNFKSFVIPEDKRLWKVLDKRYQQEELQYDHPVLLSRKFIEKPISTEDFATQVRLSNKDHFTIQKKLKQSNKQVLRAKGGASRSRRQPKPAPSSLSCPKSKATKSFQSETSVSGLDWPMFHQKGSSQRFSPSATTVTAVPTQRSAPVVVPNLKESKPPRSSSCPPMITPASRDQTTVLMNLLKFEMHTKDRRWADHFTSEISRYLPNYEDVMARIRKPPAAPARRKAYRPERPSPSVIRRLSEPKPTMPGSHVTHCNAITMGVGTDDHAVALQRHGNKHAPRCPSADGSTTLRKRKRSACSAWRSLSERRTTFLEKLLADDDQLSDKEENPSRLEVTGLEEKSDSACEKYESEDECVAVKTSDREDQIADEAEDAPLARDLSFLKPRDRMAEALAAMKEDFARVYLDPCCVKQLESEDEDELKAEWSSRDLTYQRFPRPPSGCSVESQTTEVTEFEKFLGDPENLRIPDDVFIGRTGKSQAELRRIRKSFARITHRFAGDEKIKVASLLREPTAVFT